MDEDMEERIEKVKADPKSKALMEGGIDIIGFISRQKKLFQMLLREKKKVRCKLIEYLHTVLVF